MSSFSRLFRLLGDTRSIRNGIALHAKIITSQISRDIYTNNHLLAMYVKFNRIVDARKVFDGMPERNVISWTALISGYSQMGMAEKALDCLSLMVSDGLEPNYYTVVSAVSACASLGDGSVGKEVHGRIYRSGVDFSTPVCNSLINMYGKCGLLKSAQLVFDAMLEPNLISWTSLLSCYCQQGENMESLKIFVQSRRVGVRVNEFTCASVLSVCAGLEDLKVGMQIHGLVVKCGLEFDKFVETGLISFYTKCGELILAGQVFLEVNQSNVAAWTSLIGGYVQQGRREEAIDLFLKLHSSGIRPSERTFSSVLGACADAEVIEVGKQFHSLIAKMGYVSFIYVGNAVLDFYSKCGLLQEALRTFEDMDGHDMVSWNSLISGHVGSGQYEDAIELLKEMLFQGYKPNLYTYSSILNICSDVPAIEWGKQTHCCIIKPAFDSNVVVGSALIDMYAKCGVLNAARKVFDYLTSKNLVSWNTMLVGYAQHGFAREALEIYCMMQRDDVKPNDVTFVGVLSACAHAGLSEEGLHYYNSMIRDHSIAPKMEHLASIVNLLARKGATRRAYDFIRSFPTEPSKVVWRCLLSGCKSHKDLVLGRFAVEKILSIDPEDTSAYIMLSNIYAEAKMWDETAQLRKIMKEKAMKKDTGYTWIELKNKVYSFSASHFTKFQRIDLTEVLNQLTLHLFNAGYLPDDLLCFHSEK
ncbi:PREDICTED: pentatricopeptide repeat-containing protein At2g27610 [Theobroma cacao]|uniref:Pentatricopeptide repeat-containing protein At2g27610 n=1 Tax=Theobroma cacao TaxID=3641 RepID=A0AB32WZR0_THECC|nr:PREDICTED: pentatricopeptide repeat-containing protein At2g27610 [Theobroma cacao]